MTYKFLLIGMDEDACASLRPFLEQLREKTGGAFTCDRLLVVDASQVKRLSLGTYSGIIPILSKGALGSGVFGELMRRFVEHLKTSDAFFVIPWLHGINVADLQALAQRGNATAGRLLDTIHITEGLETRVGVADTVRSCCENAQGLRLSTMLGNVARKLSVLMGYIALTALFLTAVFIYAAAFFKNEKVKGPAFFESLIRRIPDDVNVTIVIALLTTFAIYFWQLLQLKARGARFAACYSRMKVEFQPVLFLSLGAAFLFYQIAVIPQWKTIVVGMGFGVLVMALFRAGCRAKRGPFSFVDIPQAIRARTLLRDLYARMATCIAHTGKPFMTPTYNRVFVSYSRSSAWCCETAGTLVRTLQHKGSHVFFDRQGLAAGLPWKTQLQRALDEVNVFIIVLDEHACQREWVISEFSHAYLAKMLTRSPEMFIVHPPHIDFARLDKNYPNAWFFSEIVVQPSVSIPDWMRMKMAAFEESTCDAMCTAIRWRHFLSPSAKCAVLLKSVVMLPVQMVLTFFTVFGPFLLAIPYFVNRDEGKTISPMEWCSAHSQHASYGAWFCAAQVGLCVSVVILRGFGPRTYSRRGTNLRATWVWYYAALCGFGYAAWFCSRLFGWQDYAIMFLAFCFGVSLGTVAHKEKETYDEADLKTGNAPTAKHVFE